MNAYNQSDRGVLVGLAGIVVLLVANAGLSYRNVRQLNDNNRSVDHTHDVLDGLADIRAAVNRAAVVQRTYLVTEDNALLPEMDAALGVAEQNVGRVGSLTADNPDQQARTADLAGRVKAVGDRLRRTVAVRSAEGFDAARRVVQGGESQRQIEGIHELVTGMEGEEDRLLALRRENSERAYTTAVVSGLVAALTGLAAVGMVVWLLQRHLAARTRAAAEIEDRSERLRTTLASIGDAVITTDTAGRVTGMNAVAEALTGWSTADAAGVPLAAVFNIVNEDTRRPVENPAFRALREGVIVGLANHTVLIARDGTERPIDDSAAPIRCKAGEVVGCVLVFRDITERHEAERRLRESERQFRTLAESIPQLCWMAEPDGHIFWYNRRWYDYTGTTPEQMEGWGWQSVHDPDVLPQVLERWKASIATGRPFDMVFPLRGKDGAFRPFLTRVEPVADDGGRVARWFGTNTDIGEVQRLEASEREANRRLRSTLESLTDGFWQVGPD